MADTELAPCPFCGAPAEYELNYDANYGNRVACTRCPAAIDIYMGDLSAWNRRSTSSVSEGEMPELPKPDAISSATGENWWEAKTVLAYGDARARAAIAADRRARHGEPVANSPEFEGIKAVFEFEEDGLGGQNAAKIKRIDRHDGGITVVIDHWPEVATKAAAPADTPLNWYRIRKTVEALYETAIEHHGSRDLRTRIRMLVVSFAEGRAPTEDAREEVQDHSDMNRLCLAILSLKGQHTRSCFAKQVDLAHYNEGFEDACKAAAALVPVARRATSVPAIPGWKLVPIEPTDEQWRAGVDEWNDVHGTPAGEDELPSTLYRAMVRAAPSHPLEANAGEDA
jgi:hypothetical protein